MISDLLIKKISKREANVAVMGLGYVGLTLAVAINKAGYQVNGYDINKNKVDQLSEKKSSITDVTDNELSRAFKTNKFNVYSSFKTLADNDIFLIAVQTNLDKHKVPHLKPLRSVSCEIAHALRGNQLIVLESTVFPGALEDIVLPCLNKYGQKIDRDFLVSASPERTDPGNQQYPLVKIPKLVGSLTKDSQKVAVAFYKTFIKKVVPVKNDKIAQLSKLLENTYRAVNIALVNELMMISEKLGVDIWEVVDAAKTKPFGFSVFYPGPGTGGSCIPIDPFYLVWKISEISEHSEFIEMAAKINERVPRFLVDRLVLVLNNHGQTITGAKILIIGVAYKPDVMDLSQSPVFPVIKELIKNGAQVSFYDPFYNELNVDGNKISGADFTPATIKSKDIVLIMSNHSSIDYEMIKNNAKLIFDSRNQYKERCGNIYHL